MLTNALIRLKVLPLLLLAVCSLRAQPEKGLVAKYTFNKGTPEDEAGSSDAKAVGASPTSDRFGNKRSAYFIQGTYGSYINLGTSNVLKPLEGTISLWFRLESKTYNGGGIDINPIILAKSKPGDDFYEAYSIYYEITADKITFSTTFDQSQQVCMRSDEEVPIRQWHHVAIAYNDTYTWAYLDGVMQNDGKPMFKNFRSHFLEGDSVMLGHTANCKNERFFCGKVDDIFIYNRVLDPKEVLELYNAEDPNVANIYWRWFYFILLFIGITALAVWLITLRYRRVIARQREKEKISLRLTELETKAIRSQMNPHFIFNSLNTLQRFILEDDKRNAYTYLIEFSTLLRKLLESSELDMISLKEEIDILDSYLKIEKLRFDNLFEYKIVTDVKDMENVHIPFMMLQPFVENAIWHGLLNKENDRLLKITFSDADSSSIRCVIEDNGVGRNFKAKEKDPIKKKSLAIDLIRQRLDLLERSTGTRCTFEITDLAGQDGRSLGTRVEIIIPKLK